MVDYLLVAGLVLAVNVLPAFGPPTWAVLIFLKLLAGSRGRAIAGLGLFALSPVPSAQLFVGAGLLRVPLVPLTAAFFAGRLVSYSLYVGPRRWRPTASARSSPTA